MSLLVSLHDVAPPHLAACQRQRDDLDRWGVDRATLLVVPDFHGAHPLGRSPETVRWLRARIAAGDEVALHGFFHRQRGPIAGRLDRLRAAWLTAGEGECLAQAGEERGRRLIGTGAACWRICWGWRSRAMSPPPGWSRPGSRRSSPVRASTGTRRLCGWRRVTATATVAAGWRRRRGPVIGFATRTRARLFASLAWARLLAPALETGGASGGIARPGGAAPG